MNTNIAGVPSSMEAADVSFVLEFHVVAAGLRFFKFQFPEGPDIKGQSASISPGVVRTLHSARTQSLFK